MGLTLKRNFCFDGRFGPNMVCHPVSYDIMDECSVVPRMAGGLNDLVQVVLQSSIYN